MQLLQRGAFLAIMMVPGTVLAAGPPPVGSPQGGPASAPHISTPASEESVKQLLQIMGIHQLLDENLRQVDERVTAGLQREYAGRNLTPEQEAILMRTRDKVAAVVKESISWEAMEPVSIRIYREALTQEELDGMLAFYKTPAGEAVIKKLPRLSQDMSNEIQGMLRSMMPKLIAIQKQSEDEMKLASPIVAPSNAPSDAHSPSVPASAPPTNPGASPNSPNK
jgi:hypothetical protein